jgi:hypothetical protein
MTATTGRFSTHFVVDSVFVVVPKIGKHRISRGAERLPVFDLRDAALHEQGAKLVNFGWICNAEDSGDLAHDSDAGYRSPLLDGVDAAGGDAGLPRQLTLAQQATASK